MVLRESRKVYRNFPNKGAGCEVKTLGGTPIGEFTVYQFHDLCNKLSKTVFLKPTYFSRVSLGFEGGWDFVRILKSDP